MKVATFCERLGVALEYRGIKAVELCRLSGINKSTVSQYLSGKYEAKHSRVVAMAAVLGCNPYWLEGYDAPMLICPPDGENGGPTPDAAHALPVLGYVSAGGGVFAQESITGYEYADSRYCDNEHFYLIVKGDSMAPSLTEGDRVLCRKQSELEHGQLGVFIIDGEDGVVKQYLRSKNRIALHSFNPYYPDRVFEEAETERVLLVGRVIQSVRHWS